MIATIFESDALSTVQDLLVAQAIHECYITEESLAFDALHFEARNKPETDTPKRKVAPKKRSAKQSILFKKSHL